MACDRQQWPLRGGGSGGSRYGHALGLGRGFWVILLLLLITSLPAFAGELAVLRNGFSIRHVRRAEIGPNTRLYVTADGSSFVDVPTAQIDHYEPVADPPPITPATPIATPTTTASAAPSQPPMSIDQAVTTASSRYQLDPDLVNSVIRAESGFNVRARSRKGAQGLMQLMPQTASHLGVSNVYDPRDNVDGGTKYLRELLEKYNFDLVKALAAYNAGPERVEKFHGVPPFHETRVYVAKIVHDFNRKKIAEANKAKAASGATPTAAHTQPHPPAPPPARTTKAQTATTAPVDHP